MTPAPSTPSTRPCLQRQRRRLLVVGGVTVPAVVLGGILIAAPAQASDQEFTAKSELTTAFGVLTPDSDETYRLTANASAASTDPSDDTQTVPAGHVTIDLNGNDLHLDRLNVSGTATVTVEDLSPEHDGHLVVDGGIVVTGDAGIVIDGADVAATGSAGHAGIGGADGGEHVTVQGSAHVTATGGSGAAGIGGDTGSAGANVSIAGTAVVTAVAGSSSSAVGGSDEDQEFGSLTVGAGSTLSVPSGSDLVVPSGTTVENAGTLRLAGNAAGHGTIRNTGSIALTGSIGPDVHVTGNAYTVTLGLAGGTANGTPASAQLYTARFAALSGYAPTRTGFHFLGWKAGTTTVDATTDLGTVASNGAVALVAQWSRDVAVTGDQVYVSRNVALNQMLPITGDGITVTRTSGSLPAGLSLTPAGKLTGTPTRNATSTFGVTIHSRFEDVTHTFRVTVGDAAAVTTDELPVATIARPYSATVDATGSGDVSLSAPNLPAGLTMNSDGTITGTPSGAAGAVTVHVAATSEYGTTTRDLVIRVGSVPAVTTPSLPTVKIDQAYSQVLTATGEGTQHFTLAPGSTLPAGLALDTDGTLHGTYRGDAGSATFSVRTASEFGTSPDVQYTILLGHSPSLAATTLAPVVIGSTYSASLPSAGDGAKTFTLASGSVLPAGLTLSPSGTITSSGDATGPVGSTTFAVDVATDFGTATRSYALVVGDAPSITTSSSSLPVVKLGQAYSATVVATGSGQQELTLTGDTSLPAGLTLHSDGTISGTPTGSAGDRTFTVKVSTPFGVDTKPFTVHVGSVPSFDSTALDAWTTGVQHSQSLPVSGTDVSTAVTTGTLPAGLTLTNGVLSGTVNAHQEATFTVTATSIYGTATHVYTLHVGDAPSIRTSRVAQAVVGSYYETALVAAGDGLGAGTYSVSAGSLPDGLDLDPDTGVISGYATAAGSSTFTIALDTAYGRSTHGYTLPTGTPPVVTTETLPAVVVGSAYSADLAAGGTGSGSATFRVTAGGLPAGITLNQATGHLSGTVQSTGTATFTVTTTTDFGTASRALTLVAGTAPRITAAGDDVIQTQHAYAQQLSSSGSGAAVWSVVGTLPAGIALDPATGLLSGTPTTPGSSTVTVKVTTPFGSDTAPIVLRTGDAPSITTLSLAPATVGSAYSADLAANGTGAGSATFAAAANALPAGLQLSASGHLAGTVDEAGDTTVTFTVTTAFGTANRVLTISAGTAPVVTTDAVHTLAVGRDFSQHLAASGTGAKQWTVTAGALPDGLTLATDGTLAGAPVTTGDYDFTVTATSPFDDASQRFTGTIGRAGSVTTTALPNATVGTAYRVVLQTAGSGDVALALTGALPDGLSFDSATGVLSGTPTRAGTVALTATATNAYGASSRDLSLLVAAAPVPAASTPAAPTPAVPTAATPTPAASTPAAPAPAPVVAAPVLPQVAKATALLGHSFAMSVAASSTVPVRYSTTGALPDGLTLNTASGVISGTPTDAGSFTFSVVATSSAGSDTERYSVVVPEKAPVVDGSAATTTPAMGKPFAVTLKGLKKGERWHVKVDGTTVEHGVATGSGDVVRSVTLPKTRKDHTYTVRVDTSRSVTDPAKSRVDEFEVTAVAAKKTLKLSGSATAVTVKGLAAKERISVSEGKKLVAQGHADADGVFTFTPRSLSTGRHKLVATGKTEDRTGSATVTIKR